MTPEDWARRIVERELKRAVTLHDDGSRPGMVDLVVGDALHPDVAIECVGAVDPVRGETWNSGPAPEPLELAVAGDWTVELMPGVRMDSLSAPLEALLQECEELEISELPDWRLQRSNPSLAASIERLRIESAHCFRTRGQGLVHLSLTGIGGAVDREGTALPAWIEEFLRAPERADVLSKLESSGAKECHVFVSVAVGGAAWEVESYLGREIETLPASPPDLPPPVSAVWIAYGENGVRWDGAGWRQFENRMMDS
ncbi:MAG TPA: hypothetical protein VFQ45_05385 [Longimicrobium sp.]|nr:hypothetical protein [Longimicrobium sp.]